MKKIKIIISTIVLLTLCITSCKSDNEKAENTKLLEQETKINIEPNDSLSDYAKLKKATITIIASNEQKILEFKKKLKVEKLVNKKEFQENINILEAKNKELKNIVFSYKEQGKTQLETLRKRLQKSMDDVNKDIENYKKEHNY